MKIIRGSAPGTLVSERLWMPRSDGTTEYSPAFNLKTAKYLRQIPHARAHRGFALPGTERDPGVDQILLDSTFKTSIMRAI